MSNKAVSIKTTPNSQNSKLGKKMQFQITMFKLNLYMKSSEKFDKLEKFKTVYPKAQDKLQLLSTLNYLTNVFRIMILCPGKIFLAFHN